MQQIHLHTAVHSAYLAAYQALARSNADLLVGASDTERIRPGWLRACQSLGGDYSNQRLQGDYSGHPEAIRMFADTFLALHHQRLLADEDPSATFAAAEAQAWVERASDAINAFLSADPLQRSPSPLRYCCDRREHRNLRTNRYHRLGLQRRQSVKDESPARWHIVP